VFHLAKLKRHHQVEINETFKLANPRKHNLETQNVKYLEVTLEIVHINMYLYKYDSSKTLKLSINVSDKPKILKYDCLI
jgi:hypothetical protein